MAPTRRRSTITGSPRDGAIVTARSTGHTTPEMLFSVYARYIPNRTRRDGSALLALMEAAPTAAPDASPAAPQVSPKEPGCTPNLLPSLPVEIAIPFNVATLRKPKCERGDLNPHGCLAHRILNPARLPVPPLSRERR